MIVEALYLIPMHRYMFKFGKKLKIIGVTAVKPSDVEDFRPCYHVIDETDGKDDFIPLSEKFNFLIVRNNEEYEIRDTY